MCLMGLSKDLINCYVIFLPFRFCNVISNNYITTSINLDFHNLLLSQLGALPFKTFPRIIFSIPDQEGARVRHSRYRSSALACSSSHISAINNWLR